MATHGSRFLGLLGLLGFLALSLCPPSHAATYYVAKNGSNSNDGSTGSPFLTITHGASVLRPGDVLIVRAGTYTERLHNVFPGGTSWSASGKVTVKAEVAGAVTILPPAGSGDLFGVSFTGSGTKYIEIDGFVIDGDGPGDAMWGVHISSGAHHIRIQNTEIKNTLSNGLLINAGHKKGGHTDSCCNEFININVHHTGRNAKMGQAGGGHGIYCETSNNVIERSWFHHNAGYGVHIYSSNGGVNNNTIRYNRVNNNNLKKNPAGMVIGSGSGNKAYNNLIYDNAGGITITAGGSSVYNNTIVNNVYSPGADSDIGIIANAGGGSVQIVNNIIYGHPTTIAGPGATTAAQSHNLTTNPHFRDIAAKDFRLTEASPARNAGTALSLVLDDFLGVKRPQGNAYAIGAYEWTADGGPVVPPPSPTLAAPRNVRVLGPTP